MIPPGATRLRIAQREVPVPGQAGPVHFLPCNWDIKYVRNKVLSNPEHPLYRAFSLDDAVDCLFQCKCASPPPLSCVLDGNGKDMEREAFMMVAKDHLCTCFTEKYVIYGLIGNGTFGTVFACRERHPVDASCIRHFAVKLQSTEALTTTATGLITPWLDRRHLVVHREAYSLWVNRFYPNVIPVVECYQHGPFNTIVMPLVCPEPTSTYDKRSPLEECPMDSRNRLIIIPTHNGTSLCDTRHNETYVNELQAAKVSAGLISGFHSLRQNRILQYDLSPRNFMVDTHLNVSLIDLDQCEFCPTEHGFIRPKKEGFHHGGIEELCPPELVAMLEVGLAFSAHHPSDLAHVHENSTKGIYPYRPSDGREDMLWRAGAIWFEYVHGTAPWGSIWKESEHLARRARIIRQPLAVREDLSQDGVDFLHETCGRVPGLRPKLCEHEGFPWVAWPGEVEAQRGDKEFAWLSDSSDSEDPDDRMDEVEQEPAVVIPEDTVAEDEWAGMGGVGGPVQGARGGSSPDNNDVDAAMADPPADPGEDISDIKVLCLQEASAVISQIEADGSPTRARRILGEIQVGGEYA